MAVLVWLAGVSAAAEAPKSGQILNLSCLQALVAVDEGNLAGVFSFVPEKDSPAAFADLVVRNPKAMKKYLAMLEKDLKEVSGISAWDHEVLAFAVSVYASPLASTLEKPAPRILKRLLELNGVASLTLQEMTSRRSKP